MSSHGSKGKHKDGGVYARLTGLQRAMKEERNIPRPEWEDRGGRRGRGRGRGRGGRGFGGPPLDEWERGPGADEYGRERRGGGGGGGGGGGSYDGEYNRGGPPSRGNRFEGRGRGRGGHGPNHDFGQGRPPPDYGPNPLPPPPPPPHTTYTAPPQSVTPSYSQPAPPPPAPPVLAPLSVSPIHQCFVPFDSEQMVISQLTIDSSKLVKYSNCLQLSSNLGALVEHHNRRRLQHLSHLRHPSITNSPLLPPTLTFLPSTHLHRNRRPFKADHHRATPGFHPTC